MIDETPLDIVISGYYGYDNAGDEAVLAGIIEALELRSDKLRITALSGSPKRTSEVHNIHAIPRMSLREVWRALKGCDLFISGGGSLFQDSTSLRTVPYYAGIVKMASSLGKPCMMYAQGVGPLTASITRFMVSSLRNDFSCVTVRDKESYELLERLRYRPDKVVVTADPVFALNPVGRNEAKELLGKGLNGDISKCIGMSVRELVNRYTDMDEICNFISYLVDKGDHEVVLIPFHYPGDLRLSDAIIERCNNKKIHVLRGSYTPRQLLGIVGVMDVIIGMRLHSLIFAAKTCVPFIGLSYDPKVTSLCVALDAPFHDVAALKAKELMGSFEQVVANSDIIKARFRVIGDDLYNKALTTADLAIGLASQQ